MSLTYGFKSRLPHHKKRRYSEAIEEYRSFFILERNADLNPWSNVPFAAPNKKGYHFGILFYFIPNTPTQNPRIQRILQSLRKNAKTYQNRAKTSKLRAGAPFLRCSGAIFMPLRSVMPVLAAFQSVLLIAFLCSVKKLAKQHPTGPEYF